MSESNALASLLEPFVKLGRTTHKAKHRRPLFAYNTSLIPVAETSIQGHRQTCSMAHTLSTNAEGTGLAHISILSSRDDDPMQSKIPLEEEATATSKLKIPKDISQALEALSPTGLTIRKDTTHVIQHQSSKKLRGKSLGGSTS